MSKGVHNITFYVSPDPECSRTTQNSEISLAPSRGRILYAIYGNSTCIINHIVITAIDKIYRNYYISTPCADNHEVPHTDNKAHVEMTTKPCTQTMRPCTQTTTRLCPATTTRPQGCLRWKRLPLAVPS